MKKFLAALLALSLTFGSVALPAAESGVIARGVNISAKVEMPLYQAFSMVGNGDWTFDKCRNLTNITKDPYSQKVRIFSILPKLTQYKFLPHLAAAFSNVPSWL